MRCNEVLNKKTGRKEIVCKLDRDECNELFNLAIKITNDITILEGITKNLLNRVAEEEGITSEEYWKLREFLNDLINKQIEYKLKLGDRLRTCEIRQYDFSDVINIPREGQVLKEPLYYYYHKENPELIKKVSELLDDFFYITRKLEKFQKGDTKTLEELLS